MKRTNTRKIILPQLQTDGSDASEEHNALSYNWVMRTAVPTLEENILDPFEAAMKEDVFAMACKAEDLPEGAFLRERHTKKWDFSGIRFYAHAYRHSSISHEAVLGQAQTFLEDCIADKSASVQREFVLKSKEGLYVSPVYVLDAFGRWRDAHTKFYNKQEIHIEGDFSSEASPLTVSLDTKRFRVLSAAHAETYLRAKNLKKNLTAYVKDFTEHVRERHAVDAVAGELEIDYELSEGSAVRYFFFPKDISIHYAKMIGALTQEPEKGIVASTGDLVILRDLGFREIYEKKGSGRITVSTERTHGALGICTLDRGDKGKVCYSIFDHEHKGIYVQIEELLDRICDLRTVYSSGETQMKVDFFPGAPGGF